MKYVSSVNGKAISGLIYGDTVVYNGKEYIFLEYRDYGFTCLLKDKKNTTIFVFATQIKPKPTLSATLKRLIFPLIYP
jgi:hypothetical protein